MIFEKNCADRRRSPGGTSSGPVSPMATPMAPRHEGREKRAGLYSIVTIVSFTIIIKNMCIYIYIYIYIYIIHTHTLSFMIIVCLITIIIIIIMFVSISIIITIISVVIKRAPGLRREKKRPGGAQLLEYTITYYNIIQYNILCYDILCYTILYIILYYTII